MLKPVSYDEDLCPLLRAAIAGGFDDSSYGSCGWGFWEQLSLLGRRGPILRERWWLENVLLQRRVLRL